MSAMTLFYTPTSPYARRVRLVAAMKGISFELRNVREKPEYQAELERINPMQMVPTLVDDGRVIPDSHAICQYLDRKAPTPPAYPPGVEGAIAFELEALADTAINIIVDGALRYRPLADSPAYPAVREAMMKRAQGAIDLLAEKVGARPAGPLSSTWGYADIVVLSLVLWLEGIPERAKTFALAKDILDLGWKLPKSLSTWADQHRNRADVLAVSK